MINVLNRLKDLEIIDRSLLGIGTPVDIGIKRKGATVTGGMVGNIGSNFIKKVKNKSDLSTDVYLHWSVGLCALMQ